MIAILSFRVNPRPVAFFIRRFASCAAFKTNILSGNAPQSPGNAVQRLSAIGSKAQQVGEIGVILRVSIETAAF